MPEITDAERVARRFHEVYELLAPDHGYETRPESAVRWPEVPAQNRELMIDVADFLLRERTIEVGPQMPDQDVRLQSLGSKPKIVVYGADEAKTREWAKALDDLMGGAA